MAIKIVCLAIICLTLFCIGGIICLLYTASQPRTLQISDPRRLVNHSNEKVLLYSDNFFYHENNHFVENGRIYLRHQSLGRNASRGFLRNQRIVICATLRNAATALHTKINDVERFGSFFRDYAVVVVENDSADETRPILLRWASRNRRVTVLGCGVNRRLCSLKHQFKRDILPGHENRATFELSRLAAWKMASYRNVYLDYVSQHSALRQYDYLGVYEMDNKYEVLWERFPQFISTMRHSSVDAICGAEYLGGSLKLRDPCTFVMPPLPKYTTYWMPDPQFHWFVSYLLKESRRDHLLKVQSCYQGIAVYRLAVIVTQNIRYRGPPRGLLTCEHNELSYQLKNIYIDRSFVIRCC